MAMIRSDNEYADTRGMIERIEEDLEQKRAFLLSEHGLTEEQADKALEPSLCFLAGLEDQCSEYDNIQCGELEYVEDNYMGMPPGIVLIAIRIASGVTIKTVSEDFGVDANEQERNDNFAMPHEEMIVRARWYGGHEAEKVMKRRLVTAFSEEVNKTLEKTSLTVMELADGLGVSGPTVQRWLDGEASVVPGAMTDAVLASMKKIKLAHDLKSGLEKDGRAELRDSKGEPMMVVEENTFDIE